MKKIDCGYFTFFVNDECEVLNLPFQIKKKMMDDKDEIIAELQSKSICKSVEIKILPHNYDYTDTQCSIKDEFINIANEVGKFISSPCLKSNSFYMNLFSYKSTHLTYLF